MKFVLHLEYKRWWQLFIVIETKIFHDLNNWLLVFGRCRIETLPERQQEKHITHNISILIHVNAEVEATVPLQYTGCSSGWLIIAKYSFVSFFRCRVPHSNSIFSVCLEYHTFFFKFMCHHHSALECISINLGYSRLSSFAPNCLFTFRFLLTLETIDISEWSSVAESEAQGSD